MKSQSVYRASVKLILEYTRSGIINLFVAVTGFFNVFFGNPSGNLRKSQSGLER